jgi:hypothetical protein
MTSRGDKLKRPISRQRMERMDKDAIYNAIGDVMKEENPVCYYCDTPMPPSELQSDHIASGIGGRAKSLLNFETINNSCAHCNSKHLPPFEKIAAKLVAVIRATRRMRSRAFTEGEDAYIQGRVRDALAERPER